MTTEAGKLTSAWLSPLYAGSNGMKCHRCQDVTWCVWLTDDELKRLPPDSYAQCPISGALMNLASEAALLICQEKLGQVLCIRCASTNSEPFSYPPLGVNPDATIK